MARISDYDDWLYRQAENAMSEDDFEEMEQAERQKHDDKVKELEEERKEIKGDVMTDEEKAIAYCEEYAKENNLASLQNVPDFIIEAFIAGMNEERGRINQIIVMNEKRVDKIKFERDALIVQNKHLQELVDTLHAVLEDTKNTLTALVGDD